MPSATRRLFAASVIGAALLAAGPVLGQMPGLAPAPTPSTAEVPGDLYRRETPSGAFFGYMRAASRQNWILAAEYLQWPKGARVPPGEVAKELKAVLDERFAGDLQRLSRSPLGDVNDGLSPDLERAGAIERGADSFDVLLVRTQPAEGPAVWLVSSQTLREVPAAFKDLTTPALDRIMPAALQRSVGGAFRLWQVLAFWALIPIAWLLARLLVAALLAAAHGVLARRSRDEGLAGSFVPFRGPLTLLAAVPLHIFAVARIGLPLLGRYNYGRISRLLVIAAIAWLLIRAIRFLTSRATLRLMASGATAASSLTIGRRVVQGAIVLAAVLTALASLGVNLTATLAGLGIGGIAVAFAAQKSLENLFGGVVVLTDKILNVGDVVRIGTVQGTVEDVTLYATRIRTLDRTVVSIPNGAMMTSEIENLSRRDKFWFRHVLGLRFETTRAQMQAVLAGCRERLAADPRVEPATLRVRFLKLNAYTLDVEVFAYLVVPDWTAFLAAQEELLLALMHVVESAGSGFAFPSQTTYLASEAAALEPGAPPPAAPRPPR
ncbi:MAG: mechanosensitive ion channel family protein [Acidobacteriota bacterium]|nr:mechanosensitive ion channel family protein [Acidobacteriota bacterium]